MRLFIAANFDEKIVSALTELQEGLRKNGAEGNFTRPENLHLTLAFIGEYGNPEDVLDMMEMVSFQSMPLCVEGLQHYRDMYLLRMQGNTELESYVKRLRRILAEQGIPFDRKKFSPHITLIRKVSFRNGSLELPERLPEIPFCINKVSLMRSERGKKGMIYTELGSVESKLPKTIFKNIVI